VRGRGDGGEQCTEALLLIVMVTSYWGESYDAPDVVEHYIQAGLGD